MRELQRGWGGGQGVATGGGVEARDPAGGRESWMHVSPAGDRAQAASAPRRRPAGTEARGMPPTAGFGGDGGP
jgi:hypothetical protein